MKLDILCRHILILYLFIGSTSAQIKVQPISENEVYNSIHCISQDSLGYLWIGTNDGLIKHDAYNFLKIRPEPGKKNALGRSTITSLYLSKKGDLWLSSGGLVKLDYTSESFIGVENQMNPSFVNRYDARCITEDRAGNIWFCTNLSLTCFDPVRKVYRNYSPLFQPITSRNNNFAFELIAIDPLNNLWIVYNKTKISMVPLDHPGQAENINLPVSKETKIFQIYIDKKNHVCLVTSEGLMIYNTASKSFERAQFPVRNIFRMADDHSGYTWISTAEGLLKAIWNDDKVQIVKKFSNYKNFVRTLYCDNSGVLWLGTDNGVDKIDLTQKPFHIYKEERGNENSLLGNHVNAICQTKDGILWVGTTAGITGINREKDIFYRYTENPAYHPILVRNSIFALTEINGKLYIGGTGFQKADFIHHEFEYAHPDTDDSSSLNEWIVWSLYNNPNSGNIWIGTMEGFCKIEQMTEQHSSVPVKMKAIFKQYHFLSHSDLKGNRASFCIFEDSEGIVWSGTANGLIRYDVKNNQCSNIYVDSTYMANSIKFIFEDSKKRLWAGSEGKGLHLINRKDLTVATYKMKDGLASDMLWGMEEDRHGNLWISTGNGLSKFNPDKKSFRNYDVLDGISCNEFTQGAYFQNKEGELFFGGMKGVVAFHPDSIQDNPYPPRTVLNKLYIFNKPVVIGDTVNGDVILHRAIFKTKEIVLSHKNSVLSIEFTGLHFANPLKNTFAYQMEGFDQDWNYTGYGRRIAHYTNLKAGEYLFRVKSSNPDGIESTEEAQLKIIILPPFWQTWWFRLILILFIISAVIMFYRYRTYQLKKRNELLEGQVKERTREIEHQKEELALQAEKLHETNVQLVEHQGELEAASEELRAQSEELQFTNEELIKLNATKDRFFSIIGHDLKNPFHAILSFAELLCTRYDEFSDDQKKEFLSAIKDSSQGAYKLLENLLDWARSQTNEININPQNISLHEIVAETKNVLALNADKKKISVLSKVSKDSFAFADKNMITTVVRNIINNAIKFTPEGGTIILTSNVTCGSIELSICDNGIGMTKDSVDKLFRIDKQHSTSGTSGEKGTGLGLLICHDFIGRNKGRIHVKSELNKGTCFSILLPVSDKPADYAPEIIIEKNTSQEMPAFITEPEPESETVAEPSSYSLLIVEDNANIRLSIKQAFSNAYRIYEAEDGAKGYQMAVQYVPELIISDVMMPELNGFELCEKLKTNIATSHIPIILLTAQSADESRLKGLETGADDYLLKPFNPKTLVVRVKNLIETRNKLREIYSRQIVIEPSQITITSVDEAFVTKAIKIVEENMVEPAFGPDQFIDKMAVGRTQLYKKIKEITGQSVNDFIRTIRLKRAAQILQQDKKTVAELAYMVGFNYPEYFSKCFKKEFGVLPTEYPSEKSK